MTIGLAKPAGARMMAHIFERFDMRIFVTAIVAIFLANSGNAETITIDIKRFKFNAPTVQIAVGDTVVWVNQDGTRHTATARDGSFDTGALSKGKSGKVTFSQAGTFGYFCKFHPNMQGQIVVN